MHRATEKNLENLVKVGEELLKKPVSRMNFENGVVEPVENAGTNMEALKRCICISISFLLVKHLITKMQNTHNSFGV